MKKWKKLGIIVVAILVFGAIALMKVENESRVVINEVCTRNGTLGIDEAHIGKDYIELYNPSSNEICLFGWFLSDDMSDLQKCCLSELYIGPKDRVMLYATGAVERENELNFRLSSKGEKLYLSNAEGRIVDKVYIPELEQDITYARVKDGASKWDICEASLGKSNDEAKVVDINYLTEPVFSHESGYYEDEFLLTISANKNETIYYTTDGSQPTVESKVYKDEILVKNPTNQANVLNSVQNVVPDWKDYRVPDRRADKITVIRAIAIDENQKISKTVTKSYIVDLDAYKNCKMISLVAEPEELYGKNGIFVTGEKYDQWYLSSEYSQDDTYEGGWFENYELTNFWKDGRNSEVVGNIQVLENGAEILNQKTGVRVQGNYTRLSNLKNLQLFSRKSYSGSRIFDEQLLEGYDRHAVYLSAVPEKAHCLGFAVGRSLDTQEYEVCPLFINGEYWYTAILMEKIDEEYFQEHYGIESENVLCLKDREVVLGENAEQLFNQMYDMLTDDDVTMVERIVMLYESTDIQSFIDWLCFNLYLCNDDVSSRKNCVMWRSIEPGDGKYEDGKWRWLLYDIDHCAVSGKTESTHFSDFSIVSENQFYKALKKYDVFCEQMAVTAMDMMNTSFSSANVEKVLGKWGYDLNYSNHFFEKRPQYMVQSLKNEFGLAGNLENVALSVNNTEGGSIILNTIEPDLQNGLWTGQYFTNQQMKVTAVPAPGYHFVGWQGTIDWKENSIKLPVIEGGISLQAIFEKN